MESSKRDGNDSPNDATKEQRAAELCSQGKLTEAEAIMRDLIAAGTDNHIIYGNLAAICGMQGRSEELINLLNKALQLQPTYPEAHNNLGVTLQEQGKLVEAITSYKAALKIKYNFPEAHNNLGNALQNQGKLKEAIVSYQTAIQQRSNFPEAHSNLGNALQKLGDLKAAVASYNRALQLNPNFVDAYYNLGNAHKEQGDLKTAIACYQNALRQKGNFPEALNNLGFTFQKLGDLKAATTSYRTALHLKPNYPGAYHNLGNALKEQGDLQAAINSYKIALELKPHFPEAHNNLGSALKEQGDLKKAIASYQNALRVNPNYPEAQINLGNAHEEHGNITAAIALYKKALELQPNSPEAHVNLSLALLLSGDYKNGWDQYEWRTKQKNLAFKFYAPPKCNEWQGEQINRENKLLLFTEQGLGDTLQFMRYVLLLRNRSIKVLLCAPARLHPLIQASGIDHSPLTPEQANKISSGYWAPLLSVPKHLKVSPSNPMLTHPYIKSTYELNSKWEEIFSEGYRPVIGINWQGNSNDTNRKGRNIPIPCLKRMIEGYACNILCLQRGALKSDVMELALNSEATAYQAEISRIADSDNPDDFLEYAAIITNCDLVITTGSTVAHLAGGIGIPTWVLLPKVPDWRWGLEGDTTFWYPSIRLFRQRERGNWGEVIERVAEALQEHFEDRPTPNKLA
ncbi:MAG: hypothetical protein CBC91_07355 [Rickettsiales bacterium TMED131]|nr:MAG: hypothetical protein CBC91_07355 [Rickettsiales bacterium TMED131]